MKRRQMPKITVGLVTLLAIALVTVFYFVQQSPSSPLEAASTATPTMGSAQPVVSATLAPTETPPAAPQDAETTPLSSSVAVAQANLNTTSEQEPAGSQSPLPTPSAAAPISPLALPTRGGAPVYGYRVVQTYPHDPEAFTQGLVYQDGVLYEGTGLRGRSSLRKVELKTGEVLEQVNLADDLFGEGITLVDGKIVQLTWQAGVGFVYDAESFDRLWDYAYGTEGWGITHDGDRLIMSDGTSSLYFWTTESLTGDVPLTEPRTPEEIGRIEVHDDDGPVVRINELEFVDGLVYAHIWLTDWLAIIDPEDGQVVGWVDFTGLLPDADRTESVDVLNGIAYDAENDRLFVTGKLWPKLFEIQITGMR